MQFMFGGSYVIIINVLLGNLYTAVVTTIILIYNV